MAELHAGTVTFLFTDIEGSTRLLKQLGERYDEVLAAQQRILRAALTEHGGREVDTQGDSSFVAFRRAKDAVAAAVDAQRALATRAWPEGVQVRVRMGLHTGEPRVGNGRYLGFGIHRAARIAAAGHGGQVLLSNATRELVEDDLPGELALRELGSYQLKDLDRPERVFQLEIDGLPSDFPPLKAAKVAESHARRRGVLVALALIGAAAVTAYALTRDDERAPTVVPNSVVKIDPTTNRIADVVRVGRRPAAVATIGPNVWVANSLDDTLTRVDTRSGETRTLGGFPYPSSLAEEGPRVWVGNNSSGVLVAIDGFNGTVVERVRLSGAAWATFLAYGANSIWVSEEESAVLRVSLATRQITTRLPQTTAHELAFGHGAAWVALAGTRQLLRIDANNGTSKRIPVGPLPSGIAIGFGAVWVASVNDDAVWRVDPVIGDVDDVVRVGDRPEGVAVAAGSVWVANHYAGTVSRIDPRTNEVVATVKTGYFPLGVSGGADGVWVAISGARDTGVSG